MADKIYSILEKIYIILTLSEGKLLFSRINLRKFAVLLV
jgi:hypothetical protein